MLNFVSHTLEQAANFEDLHKILGELCSVMNINHAAYVGCGLGAKRVALSTYPREWTNLYEQENLSEIDPVLTTTKNRLLPFIWSDRTAFPQDAQPCLNLAREFGVRDGGVAVPVRGANGDKSLLSFVVRTEKNQDRFTPLSEQLPNLMYFAQHYHSKIVDCLELPSTTLSLAPREIDVLIWAARGKTAWETAQLLSLKESTVVFYTRNACKKLKVNNKSMAVARAINSRLITA